MTKGIERTCDFCEKAYIPKSNNSKYCSRQCNNKAYSKRRTKRYQTNSKYREHVLKQQLKRFIHRYHNEPGFKEKHHQQQKDYRKTKRGREFTNTNARKTYHNHPEYNERNKIKNKEKYHNDDEWRERVNQGCRDYQKTEEGQIADTKHSAKRRDLEAVFLFENYNPGLPSVKHHVSDGFVFFIPTFVHNQFLHGRDTEMHRDDLKHVVEVLYDISYEFVEW